MKKQERETINRKLESFRKYVQQDKGDLKLTKIDRNNNVFLKIEGACLDCSSNTDIFRAGIEEALRKAVKSVNKVFFR